ncbi:MAG: sigma-E processing peptidase SpoIIGA [Ruminococcus sp.]|nr:sigma-E processing peptidase SpoIIGA [Ruminococcus sp.]
MQIIYADVLIILNIYVNFFLLRTTARVTHSPLRNFRCIAASVYGSLFSLTILLPSLGAALNIAIKAAAAVTVVLFGFGFHGLKRLLTDTAAFFASNFVLAGAVYAVYSWFKPDFIRFNNTYFYIDFSLLILIFTTSAMYLAVCIARLFIDREIGGDYMITVRYGRNTARFRGLPDTGNVLTDFFTGCPVIICDKSKFADISEFPKRIRLIPFSTVSESGLLPVFRPDEVMIENTADHSRKRADVLIGLGKNIDNAVFDPKILKL